MEYGKIIAITGLPGLFELLSSKNDGAIVRSLEDKSTKFVSSRVHNFSHLESIEVFTVRDNANLSEIFLAMEKEGTKAPDAKDGGALKKYFEKVFPEIDFERVYSSDLKKMVKWFEVLKENKIEIKLTEVPAEEEKPAEVSKPEKKAPVTEEADKPKKTAKKKPDAEVEAPAQNKTEAAPKPKAAAPAKSKAVPEKPKKELSAEPAKKPAKKAAPKKK
jgi:hypothetical protein